MKKTEMNWQENYNELLDYVLQNGQLPDKKKVEKRGLLNWWKYNKKMMKAGKLDGQRVQLLKKLGDMRIVHQPLIVNPTDKLG